VAAAFARRIGWDPMLVRGLFVVGAVFSGLGLVLYGLGWLVLPDQADGRIHLEELIRGRVTAGFWGGAVFGFLGMTVALGYLSGFRAFGFLLLVGALAVGIVLIAYAASRTAPPAGPSPYPPTGPSPYPPADPSASAPHPAAPQTSVADATHQEIILLSPHDPDPPTSAPLGSPAAPPTTAAPESLTDAPTAAPLTSPAETPAAQPLAAPADAHAAQPLAPPAVVPPSIPPGGASVASPAAGWPAAPVHAVRRASGGPIALALSGILMLALAGQLALLRFTEWGEWISSPTAFVFGAMLTLTGSGMMLLGLLGRRFGGFLALGLTMSLLAVPLSLVTVTQSAWHNGPSQYSAVLIGDDHAAPTNSDEAAAGFHLAVGSLSVDLTNDAIAADRDVVVDVSLQIGRAQLLVPAATPVIVNARLEAGDISLGTSYMNSWRALGGDGGGATGIGVRQSFASGVDVGPERPFTLTVNFTGGFGRLEIIPV
jgi:hypothetical protein